MKRAAAFNQGGKFPTIALINQAKTPLGVDLEKLRAALQKFLDTCFVPIWGYPAKLITATAPVKHAWSIIFLDNADEAGALGYHDLTKDGEPISKVFVETTLKAGEKISTTACHELAEMLIDPGAQLWAQGADNILYAYEMSDVCEEVEFPIDGIAMSDFVYPSFFEHWHKPRSVQFDYCKKIIKPFEVLPGGYQIMMESGSVRSVFGSREKEKRFLDEDRRLHRSSYRKNLSV